jgi:hypothetical protein
MGEIPSDEVLYDAIPGLREEEYYENVFPKGIFADKNIFERAQALRERIPQILKQARKKQLDFGQITRLVNVYGLDVVKEELETGEIPVKNSKKMLKKLKKWVKKNVPPLPKGKR